MRRLFCATAFLALIGIAAPASAQVYSSLDAPSNYSTAQQPMWLTGWALDISSDHGSGVDGVVVWAYPTGQSPVFWGSAELGDYRPDVGTAFGSHNFDYSGYHLWVTDQTPGDYYIVVYAHSSITGDYDYDHPQTATVTLTAAPAMNIDIPGNDAYLLQPFTIEGWAIDRAAGGGNGVDYINVWAFPPSSQDPPTFVGAYYYGGVYRPDVAAVYGPYFNYSGYSVTVNGLPTGTYWFVVFAHSYVSGTFSQFQAIYATVNPHVAGPNFDVDSGTQSDHVFDVHLSTTPATAIYYTTDGSDPISNPNGTRASYSGDITVDHSQTIKAYGLATGQYLAGAVQSASYELKVATPNVTPPSGTYAGSVTVVLSSPDPAVTYRYAYSGDVTTSSTPFPSGGLTLTSTHTVLIRGFRANWTSSYLVTRNYTVAQSSPAMALETPTTGNVLQSFTVSGWAIDRGATSGTGVSSVHILAYPNPGSGQSAIDLGNASYGSNRSDIAAAYGAQFASSGYSLTFSGQMARTYQIVASATSTVTGTANQSQSVTVSVDETVATPTFSPSSGTYHEAQSVTISSPGAAVYYTTDGSEPVAGVNLVTGPVSVELVATLKAKAVRSGFLPSATATASYAWNVNTPSVSLAPGAYQPGTLGAPVIVSFTNTDSNQHAVVYYTLDGSDPTDSSLDATNTPIVVNHTVTIKARAYRPYLDGYLPSDVVGGLYTLNAPTTDADEDGIDDNDENALAEQFFPTIHYSSDEHCAGPSPNPFVFRARHPTWLGDVQTEFLLIEYVQLYDEDCGGYNLEWPPLWPSGHPGDNESFEVFAKWDIGQNRWLFFSTTAVAHWDAYCETKTGSYSANELWVGQEKHGFATTLGAVACAPFADPASHAHVLYNAGEPNHHLNNDLSAIDSTWSGEIWSSDPFTGSGHQLLPPVPGFFESHAGVIEPQLHHSRYPWGFAPLPSVADGCSEEDGTCEDYRNGWDHYN